MISNQLHLYLAFILIISGFASVFVSSWAFHRRALVTGSFDFSCFMFTIALYSIGYAFELFSQSLNEIYWALKIQYMGIPFMTYCFLLFSIRFVTGRNVLRLLRLILLVIPFITFVLVLFIDRHSLFYSNAYLVSRESLLLLQYEAGPWYLVHFTYLISLSLAAEIILFISIFRTDGNKRAQVIILFISGLLPIITGVLTPERFRNIDIQPFSLLIMGMLLTLALLKFKMLELVPKARDLAVDSIREMLIVLDKEGVIQDINTSGRRLVLLHNIKTGDRLPEGSPLSEYLEKKVFNRDHIDDLKPYDFEYEDSYFTLNVNAVFDKNNSIYGYALIIRDTTESMLLVKELEYQAIYDELTGLFNRRQILHLARREMEISKRNSLPLGIILVDVDHFKAVNDTYGHLAGDEVLRRVAKVLQSEIRVSDFPGRYGGEEFVIICPRTDLQTATVIAERLREGIAGMVTGYEGVSLSVTACFGVYSRNIMDDTVLEELLEKSDKALYQAKARGRNRVEQFENP